MINEQRGEVASAGAQIASESTTSDDLVWLGAGARREFRRAVVGYDDHAELVLIAALMIALPLYIAPTIVAFRRNNCNRVALLLVNLVIGLAFFGLVWIGYLVWPSRNRAIDNRITHGYSRVQRQERGRVCDH